MVGLPFVLGSAAAGFFGNEAAKNLGNNQLQATIAANNNKLALADKAIDASTGDTANVVNTRNASGGVDSDFRAGSGQALFNNAVPQLTTDALTRLGNVGTQFNNVGDAEAYLSPDSRNKINIGTDAINKQVLRNNQTGGGIGNTSLARSQAAGIGDLARNVLPNPKGEALETFNNQNTTENNLRNSIAQGIQGNFIDTPHINPSGVVPQVGTADPSASPAGVTGPASLQAMIQALMTEQGRLEDKSDTDRRLRDLIAAGAFNKGTAPVSG